jgi:5-methylcytosine-specific restriction endonuclease McrA
LQQHKCSFMVYSSYLTSTRKAFFFSRTNARQSVNASGTCERELETSRLAGFCVGAEMNVVEFIELVRKEIGSHNRVVFPSVCPEKRCRKCKEWTPVSEFTWSSKQCIKCRNARTNRWRSNNTERVREIDKVHTGNYRSQKRGNGGRITADEWNALKKHYNYTCLCCKRREPEIRLSLDHVIPISKGGPNTIENVQPLCDSCNSKKHAKTIDYR